MKNFGIELEFFVKEVSTGNIIPAYKATTNLDGNPFVGELKTKIYSNIYELVYNLKSLIHEESDLLKLKGFEMVFDPIVKISKEEFISLRRDKKYINQKELELLDEISIYNKSTGKVLPSNIYKASLQINISDNDCKDIYIDGKSKEVNTSNVFDFNKIIRMLDIQFKNEIKQTNRVPGVFAIKNGILGNRVEYRSLPNNVDLDKLISILLKINKQ